MNKKARKQRSVFDKQELGVLSRAIEEAADYVVITDLEGCIEYVNPAFERTTGYAKEELLGKTPSILKSGKQDEGLYKRMWDSLISGKVFRDTLINKRKNGELFYSDQTISSIKDVSGKIKYFVSIGKDVTEYIRATQRIVNLNENLEFEKRKLEQILSFGEQIEKINNLHKLIDFIIEGAAKILEAQRCSLMLLDEDTGQLCIQGATGLPTDIIRKSKLKIGEGIAGLVAQENKPLLVEVIDADHRFNRKSLPVYKTKSFLSVPIKLNDKLIGVVNVTDKLASKDSQEVVFTSLDLKVLLALVRQAAVAIENAQLAKELKYLTMTDPLTKLYNYRHLMESLVFEIKRFKRFERPLCLLIMDMDDFKDYSDTYGHLQGDMLLKDIGELLKNDLREVDIVCRYAGDEFVVILPETDVSEAKEIAEKIRDSVEKFKAKRKVTMTIGVAKCVKNMDRHDFILKADAALYKAKQEGKNRVFCQGN